MRKLLLSAIAALSAGVLALFFMKRRRQLNTEERKAQVSQLITEFKELYLMRKYGDAQKVVERVLKADPSNFEMAFLALLVAEDQEFSKYVERAERVAVLPLHKEMVAFVNKNCDEALVIQRKKKVSIEKLPKDPFFLIVLSAMLANNDESSVCEAIINSKKATDIDLSYAWGRKAAKQYDNPERCARLALEKFPHNVMVLSALSFVYSGSKQYTMARDLIDTAKRVNPYAVDTILAETKLFVVQKQNAEAEEAISSALNSPKIELREWKALQVSLLGRFKGEEKIAKINEIIAKDDKDPAAHVEKVKAYLEDIKIFEARVEIETIAELKCSKKTREEIKFFSDVVTSLERCREHAAIVEILFAHKLPLDVSPKIIELLQTVQITNDEEVLDMIRTLAYLVLIDDIDKIQEIYNEVKLCFENPVLGKIKYSAAIIAWFVESSTIRPMSDDDVFVKEVQTIIDNSQKNNTDVHTEFIQTFISGENEEGCKQS